MGFISVGAAMGGRLASLDALDLIFQAGLVVKLVLLLLAGFSVVSWAIIYFKWREIRRAEQDSEAFLEVYREESLDEAFDAARDFEESPLAAIFVASYAELKRIRKYSGSAAPAALDASQWAAIERQLAWTSSKEALRLEDRLPFLATTGSATPFIGLFGTVVGIINAFEGIGQAGAASLAVVAPGIAEALIATAVGLLAAIPATIFYNHFVGKLRRISSAIELFTNEFRGDLQRRKESSEALARAAGE